MFLTALLCLGAQAAAPVVVNKLLAIVNDAVITFKDLDDYTRRARRRIEEDPQLGPEAMARKLRELEKDALEQLVRRKLILHEFKTAGYVLPESVVEDQVKRTIHEQYGDQTTARRSLPQEGLTFDALRQMVRENFIIRQMRLKNIAQEIIISPHKMEKYYVDHLDTFKLGDQVKLRTIELGVKGAPEATRQLAVELAAKLAEGAPFEVMAAIYSEDRFAAQGGDRGWLKRSDLYRGLTDIALALKPGRRSAVTGFAEVSADSYWIYEFDDAGRLAATRRYKTKPDGKVEERNFNPPEAGAKLPAAPQRFYLMQADDTRVNYVRTLPEVRDEIEQALIADEQTRLEKQWIDRLKAKSFIQFFP